MRGEEIANSLENAYVFLLKQKQIVYQKKTKEEFIEIIYKLNSFIKQMECHNEK